MALGMVDGPSSRVSIGEPAPTLTGLETLPLVEGGTPMLTGSPVTARVSPVEGGTPTLAGSPVTAGGALRDGLPWPTIVEEEEDNSAASGYCGNSTGWAAAYVIASLIGRDEM